MDQPLDEKTLRILLEALSTNDTATILALLEEGALPADWTDDRGYTLLHFAVARGDAAFCDALIWQHDLSVQARDEAGDTPYRLALIFGHDDLARHLKDAASRRGPLPRAQGRRRLPAGEDLPVFESLAAFRAAPLHDGRTAMALYALQGRFGDVLALALKTGETLKASDLLAQVHPGESLIFRLLQSGEAEGLFDPRLWGSDRAELVDLRAALPAVYRKIIDASGLGSPAAPPARSAPPRPGPSLQKKPSP